MATLSPGGQLTCMQTHKHTLEIFFYLSSTTLMFSLPLSVSSPFFSVCGVFTVTLNTPVCSGPSRCQLLAFQCKSDGSFQPLQCDMNSCWCMSEDGQEVSGTRTRRQLGQVPSCDCEYVTRACWVSLRQGWQLFFPPTAPFCPTPTITHGTLVCLPTANSSQSCNLICHRGYQNALPVSSFVCDTKGHQWDGKHKPLGGACQSEMQQSNILKL